MSKELGKIEEWWDCDKNGIKVYDAMCHDCCFPEEIAKCKDRKEKRNRTFAKAGLMGERYE